ncbi:Methylenetetrahydrofolate reductase (NAD(P)H) [Acidimicrobium ferrooxidans DSM 10331]|uniref:Methylenetetrahydrofolate reductase n=1 Tax=Acidimicrobium ferrooxidans (strain DSM 10331 / JCM 15462 / NBRC 103882 / ICP) TaxID=525909 RepID=C7M2P8_ACIFD|nr:methylenetetrahydrofolate reductase [Acidimicrobium ferrooxidans]ACU53292.1 Methylenetetrahydrofolate reductase (NAD(P)H) [Acidimicrobium ferrooxidans DSM 10331]
MSDVLDRYGERVCSVELWPARTSDQEHRLTATLDVLRSLPPAFVSVTYGAFGSSRHESLALIERVLADGHRVLAHLAVAGHSPEQLVALLTHVERLGADGVLALRGDPPLDDPDDRARFVGRHALELVELARQHTQLSVGVALHPSGHPEARSLEDDLDHQAAKLARADFGITQFYFEAAALTRLRGALRGRGVTRPVIPGLLVPRSPRQLLRMGEMAAVRVPRELVEALEGPDGPARARTVVGELASAALEEGSPGVHLFSMNQPETTAWLLERLDRRHRRVS